MQINEDVFLNWAQILIPVNYDLVPSLEGATESGDPPPRYKLYCPDDMAVKFFIFEANGEFKNNKYSHKMRNFSYKFQ